MTAPTHGPDSPMRYPHGRPGFVDQADLHTGHDAPAPADKTGHGARGGHGLMMLVCCIPMIVIAILLVTTGAAGSGALLWALGCVAMMAMMMFMMPGGHNHK